MCLGIPAKIISREGEVARVTIGGVEYTASLQLLPEAVIGDFVVIHAGFAIEKIDPDETAKTIKLFQEIENGLE